MFGISSFSAVINPPQSCILAVGSGVSKLCPSSDPSKPPVVKNCMVAQLSADRRVVDEAMASQFLQVSLIVSFSMFGIYLNSVVVH